MVSAVKKRRVSKKNKKAWRKHTDVADVDEFLDEKRLEERLGTPFTERHNNELFSIDKELKKTTKAPFQTKRQRRQQLKPLKCFEILTPQSKVQDPVIKRNRVKTPEERKSALVKRIEAKRKLLGIVKAKDIVAQRNRTAQQTWRESRPKRGEFNSDLWEVEDGEFHINVMDKLRTFINNFTHSLRTADLANYFRSNKSHTFLMYFGMPLPSQPEGRELSVNSCHWLRESHDVRGVSDVSY
ncbi:unnamed protein product [Timema podura]|uniref:Ribosome biogenesis protein NOP53 n=1 Tax=Timema podura TaxID=61482 RepID=A0ABN7NJG9_TIMPD|nr:unnamed protein product [Timema podura]